MTFKLGNQAKTWGSAALFFLVTTVLCGVIYTAACTGLAQLFFPHQANGSIIEVDGTKYGSELVGQRFTDEKHLWGRAMNPSTGTFTDAEGNNRQERVRDPRHHQAMHRAAPVRFSGGCARERAESEPDARRRAMMAAPIRLRV